MEQSPVANADRVVILVNPHAGSASAFARVERLSSLLKQRGIMAEVHTDLAEAIARAETWHQAGCLRVLVGVGGDGTAAELVNRTSPGMPITMLPAGTENLLARHFGLHHSPDALCQTILDGQLLPVDAGLASGRIFLVMASCGFDAAVVERVHGQRHGHIHKWTYLKPIAESMWRYSFPQIRVQLSDQSTALAVHWLFAFNLPCYGGGFRLAPHADSADGLFDVCMYRGRTLWRGLLFALAAGCRKHSMLANFSTLRSPRLRLESDEPVPYQLDGDPGGYLPLELETLPGRLLLLVPKKKEEGRETR